ncbi:hypothetical protein [Gluconacetobacter asukensis]|uniref:Uncharacterized protein n=1 Tax=Gluconacetobacter asukensis TaxID=1017181 RepID=A0A7W4J3Q0_9PROT|nr:hypothetical protein [Gluconacetobacter asukensis]MBB2174081.1 hypothetical protein [Gluconacetobacter asukensis]
MGGEVLASVLFLKKRTKKLLIRSGVFLLGHAMALNGSKVFLLLFRKTKEGTFSTPVRRRSSNVRAVP